MRHRANELITEHGARWAAAFPGAGPRVQFRRGFPVRVAIHARGADLDRAIDRPAWVTVEELEILDGDGLVDADLRRLLARMPLLRVLSTGHEVLEKVAGSGAVVPSIRTLIRRVEPARATGGGGWLPRDRGAFPNLAVLAGRWLTYHETAALDAAQRTAAALGIDAIVHYCMLHVPQHIVEVVGSRGNGPAETRCAVLGSDAGGLEHQGWYVQTWRDRNDALVGWRSIGPHAAGRSLGWFETETARRILEPLAEVGIAQVALAIPLAQRARHARELAILRDDLARRGMRILDGAPIDILAPATVRG